MKIAVMTLFILIAAAACAQVDIAPAYTPKFPGDPAHSSAEASALGYMRTVASAQREYKKKHGGFATALSALVGTGSFTRRMASTDRRDYEVKFHSTGKAYSLTLVPKKFDPGHRSFYTDESGEIRADDAKPATASSDPVNRKG